MAITTPDQQFGFLPYGSDDADVLEYFSLTSATDVGTCVVTAGDGITYNDNGAKIGATQTGGASIYITDTIALQMVSGGHVSFEVEKGFFDITTNETSLAGLWHVETNNIRIYKATGKYLTMNHGAGNNPERADVDNTGANTHVRVDISWNNSYVTVYVDYMKVLYTPFVNKPTFVDGFSVGGEGTATTPNSQYRFRNYQICKRPIVLPPTPELGRVAVVGDSFTRNGQYPLTLCAYLGYQTDDDGANTTKAVDQWTDRGLMPMMHRQLAKLGSYLGEQIMFYGRGGSLIYSTNPLSERTDAMLNTLVGGATFPLPGARNTVKHVVCICGTNDVSAGTSTANFDTAYKAEIARWIAAGVENIILFTIAERYDAAYIASSSQQASLLAFNVLIKGYESTYPEVTVIDAHPLTVADETLIHTDGIHLSGTGNVLYGELAGKELHRLIN